MVNFHFLKWPPIVAMENDVTLTIIIALSHQPKDIYWLSTGP